MKKTLAITVTGLVMSGCASQQVASFQPFQPENLNQELKAGLLLQKTNNLLVISDSSSSMEKLYQSEGYPAQPQATKLSVEKEILTRFDKAIPDIKYSSEIRSFGFGQCLDWQFTKLNMPMAPHSSAAFNSGIGSVTCPSGGSPLYSALDAAMTDLAPTTGKTAVLIVSDGKAQDGDPVSSAQALKAKYGNNLCIFSVWVGNPDEVGGRHLLQQLSNVAGCGYNVDAATLASPRGMSNFVRSVFFDMAQPKADPCLADSDGDGVNDCKDKCPGTPKNAKVDAVGCWAYHVHFDTDKATIKPQFKSVLNNAVDVMKSNPGLNVLIEGHTDSRASEAHNQSLSERRAQSVKQYLIENGVQSGRMGTKGYGESRPVDTNATDEGRYHNRRVEFKPTK